MYKGLSLSKLENNNEEFLINNVFKSTKSIKPKANKFKYYCKLKLEKDAGQIWDTPRNSNPYHCTFFKCDGFDSAKVNILEITPIEITPIETPIES